MSQAAGERQDDVARLGVSPGDDEEAAQGDERVTAPVAHVAGGEVRQAGAQADTGLPETPGPGDVQVY